MCLGQQMHVCLCICACVWCVHVCVRVCVCVCVLGRSSTLVYLKRLFAVMFCGPEGCFRKMKAKTPHNLSSVRRLRAVVHTHTHRHTHTHTQTHTNRKHDTFSLSHTHTHTHQF